VNHGANAWSRSFKGDTTSSQSLDSAHKRERFVINGYLEKTSFGFLRRKGQDGIEYICKLCLMDYLQLGASIEQHGCLL